MDELDEEGEWAEDVEAEEKTVAISRPRYSKSMWIWCPRDVIPMKGADGKTKDSSNSVGPREHVNRCLLKGCTCPNLEQRVEDINGN